MVIFKIMPIVVDSNLCDSPICEHARPNTLGSNFGLIESFPGDEISTPPLRNKLWTSHNEFVECCMLVKTRRENDGG